MPTPNLYIPNVLEICEEAAERAGVDFTAGGGLRSAKTSLDLLGIEWGNEGLNLWTLDFQVLALVAGQDKYDLPLDTLDVVQGSAIRTLDNLGKTRDLPITREDYADYASLVNKQRTGKPNTFFVYRGTTPALWFHPVPDSATSYSFAYWRLRRMQRVSTYSTSPDVPSSFVPALIAGLAYKMAAKSPKKDLNLLMLLKADYQDAFDKARFNDVDRAPVYLSPSKYWQ